MTPVDWAVIITQVPSIAMALLFAWFALNLLRINKEQSKVTMDDWAKRLDEKDKNFQISIAEKDKNFQTSISEKDKTFQAFLASRDAQFIATIKDRDVMWQTFLSEQRSQQYEATARLAEEIKRLNESMAAHFALLSKHDDTVAEFRKELNTDIGNLTELIKKVQ